MRIKFEGKYKSLTTFESENLSDFTVITGKNGSGKSQLVYCIENSNTKGQSYTINLDPSLKRIKISDLIYRSSGTASKETINTKLESYYTSFNNLKLKHKEFYSLLLEIGISLKDFLTFDFKAMASILNITNLRELASQMLIEKSHSAPSALPENVILNQWKNSLSRDIEIFEILSAIQEYSKKPLDLFERNDFYKTPLPEKYIDKSDMFDSHVETIFYNYLRRRHENEYLSFRNSQYNEKNNVLKEGEFVQKYPAPWDIINKILSENNIPLEVKTYNTSEYSDSITINVAFKKPGISDLIPFSDLSSGEQVIVGLIIKLFTEKYYETDLMFPELIVLDEPDAHLHPEMSKLLIDVLYKSFVKGLGVKVIMTTHSPSTVALSPEESIYEMSNTPCSLKKISKDNALELLTGMLPTLSIDYKNHKQIFLESPTDVAYFQKLFNKLSIEESLNHKLYFISNEMGRSNCDWVKAIVSKLREGGVSKAFGVVDWDSKNNSTSEVLVHGENKRYSIENFLYDAIYVAILFLEKLNGAHNIKSELNIDDTYNQYQLVNETDAILQSIWDWYITKILQKFAALKGNSELVEIYYYNNKKVKVPIWYLHIQGHELEEKIRATFSSLDKYRNEGDLQHNLSTIMAKCFPLVPMDSIELLKVLCD